MKESNNSALPQKRVTAWSRFKANKELLLLSLPGGIWFLIFAYLPMFGVLIAFKSWQVHDNFLQSLIKSPFVGLDNFKFLF